MVTRVYGLANGTEVIFSHAEGNAWEITVPWTDDGKYTAEIFAEDEAGNLSHLCSMLFVIAGHELQAAVVLHEMSAQVDGENRRYSTEFVDHQFMGIVQEGGYQIESVVCSRYHI